MYDSTPHHSTNERAGFISNETFATLPHLTDPFGSAVSKKRSMSNRAQAEITPDTPLRLADAVKIAFPLGGMTVAGLRRERDRNRLVIEKIAGKEFTTLAHIERMRELCREEAMAPDFSSRPHAEARPEGSLTKQPGSSGTALGMSAQAALQMRLRPRRKN
ncbi:excisionase [Bradyrhizobium sp. CSA207]|uniref:excisionase n=1 Tax=Bradyrhizobium sp. CSA207 TaxID=2698826 RepID=UPI0023AFE1C5|nr:excisionase [Bradyrhizobium sp. CSA207]